MTLIVGHRISRAEYESQRKSVVIPLEGTIPRCSHSIYFPDYDSEKPEMKNVCCVLCVPLRPENGNGRKFVLPRACNDSMNERDRVRANGHAPGTYCAKCGSAIHSEEPGGREWRCEDCGAIRPAPRKKAGHDATD